MHNTVALNYQLGPKNEESWACQFGFQARVRPERYTLEFLKNSYYLSHRTDGLRAWNTSEHTVTFRGSTGKEKRPERDIQETASNKEGLDQKVK